MVLFYAWTNLVLINMVNTKIAHFDNVEADLIIRCSPTMSQELIGAVKSAEVFRNIYFIDIPRFQKKRGLIGKIPKIRMLALKGNLRN